MIVENTLICPPDVDVEEFEIATDISMVSVRMGRVSIGKVRVSVGNEF